MKRSNTGKWGVLIAALMCSAGMAQATLIQNGGFEQGLDFWDNSCNVQIEHSWCGVTAVEGSLMAVMSPLGVLDSDLSQDFDAADANSLTLSFQYNLVAFDYSRCRDYGIDSFRVSLGDSEWIYSLDDVFDCPANSATTGWWTFSETVDVNGTPPGALSIGFHLENTPPGGGDLGQLMVAYVDNVSIVGNDPKPNSRVPDGGSTLLLVGLGLLGVETIRRKITR